MEKILVLGGTGFIGKNIVQILLEKNYDVTLVGQRVPNIEGVKFIKTNLLEDNLESIFKENEFNGMIDLAWDCSKDYKNSNSNFLWFVKTCEIAKLAIDRNISKMLIAGSYFEYDQLATDKKNYDELACSTYFQNTFYGTCKNMSYRSISKYCIQTGYKNFKWARIFNLFGKDENSFRVVPYICKCIRENKDIVLNKNLSYDYSYVKDIAGGIVATYESDVSGAVNLCSGKNTSLKEMAEVICEQLGYDTSRIVFSDESALQANEIAPIATSRLFTEVKYEPKYSIREGFEDYL